MPLSSLLSGSPDFKIIASFALVYHAVILVMHVAMAIAVRNDAKRLASEGIMAMSVRGQVRRSASSGSNGLFLFGPNLWSGVALIFGIAGVAVYWAVHHSSLRLKDAGENT